MDFREEHQPELSSSAPSFLASRFNLVYDISIRILSERKSVVAPAMPTQGAANQNVKENVYEKDLHVRACGISDVGVELSRFV